MIQINPSQEQSECTSEPIDMWCWLRLLGWRSPLFPDADEAETPDKGAATPDTTQPTGQEVCRAGCPELPKDPSTTAELSTDDERALGWAIVNDRCTRAKELLFFAGLSTLARAVDAYEGRGLATAELIEHGARGLRNAVEDFDPATGVRFSTIATWWIKQSFKEAMMERRRALATT